MPARLTPLVNEFYYHIYNRGVNRRQIFVNKHDYIHALNIIKFYNYVDYPIRFSKFKLLSLDQRREIWGRLVNSQRYVDIISYCLMPNHFHLLVKQNIDNGISKFMSNFQNSYTRYFNVKNDRTGHLLQGQFKAKKIDSDEQLLHVSRYIHLNPYSSAVVKDFDNLLSYKWSSLPEYQDKESFNICNKDIIKTYFHKKADYFEFVKDNADYQKSLEDVKHLTLE